MCVHDTVDAITIHSRGIHSSLFPYCCWWKLKALTGSHAGSKQLSCYGTKLPQSFYKFWPEWCIKNYKMWCEIYKKCKLNKFCIDGAFYLPCGLHVLGVMKTAADVLRFLCSKDKGSPRANILVWLVWGSLKGKNKTRLSIIDKRYLNMLLNFMLTQRTSWHSAICLLGRKVQLDLLLAGLWSVGEKISQPSAHRWSSDTLFDSVAN